MELLGVFILAFVQTIWLSSTMANPIISIPMINAMAANITAVNATNETTANVSSVPVCNKPQPYCCREYTRSVPKLGDLYGKINNIIDNYTKTCSNESYKANVS